MASNGRWHIRNAVNLRKMGCMWRRLNCVAPGDKKLPSGVPPGHLAVIVGKPGRKFIIRAEYLNQPVLRELLDQAYEDYSYTNTNGLLAIPCIDENAFEDIINSLKGGVGAYQLLNCHAMLGLNASRESRLLLGFNR